jgi:hypothetical protein
MKLWYLKRKKIKVKCPLLDCSFPDIDVQLSRTGLCGSARLHSDLNKQKCLLNATCGSFDSMFLFPNHATLCTGRWQPFPHGNLHTLRSAKPAWDNRSSFLKIEERENLRLCTQTIENRQCLFKFKEADLHQADQLQEHIEYLRIYLPAAG